MEKYLVFLRYDDEWSPCLLTLAELARKALIDGQLAGVLNEYAVYRLIPNKDPIRMKAVEDFGCGWMSVTLYDRYNNLVATIAIDRP